MSVPWLDAGRAGDWRSCIDAIPFMRFMRFSIAEVDGRIVGTLPYAEMLVGNPRIPALHGGTVASLLETVALVELIAQTNIERAPELVSMTIDYVRTAGPRDTHARAVVLKQGAHVATLRVNAWQADPERPVALGSAHLMF